MRNKGNNEFDARVEFRSESIEPDLKRFLRLHLAQRHCMVYIPTFMQRNASFGLFSC